MISAIKLAVIWKFAKYLYETWLRPSLQQYVEKTENDWDNVLVGIADATFNMDNLSYDEAWEAVQWLYATILRPPALIYVKDTETKFDDWLLALCDKTFDYKA